MPLNEGDVRALLYAIRRNLERAGMLAELVDYVEGTGPRMVARGHGEGMEVSEVRRSGRAENHLFGGKRGSQRVHP